MKKEDGQTGPFNLIYLGGLLLLLFVLQPATDMIITNLLSWSFVGSMGTAMIKIIPFLMLVGVSIYFIVNRS